jgi:hypothetical protein
VTMNTIACETDPPVRDAALQVHGVAPPNLGVRPVKAPFILFKSKIVVFTVNKTNYQLTLSFTRSEN